MNRTSFSIRGRCSAFTLIEVMVALVIVAISLSAVIASISQMVQVATAMQERTYANWIAQNKIAELRLSNAPPEVSRADDEVRFADIDWALTTTISETGVENLYRIDVAVFYAGSEYSIRTVSGFIGDPGIPGAGNTAWTQNSQAAGRTN